MFEKFLQTPECMKILSWLLNHPNAEYSAAIIGIECNMVNMSRYMAAISTLEGVGFIKINDFSDELMMQLDTEASITQLLTHLKEEFNDNAFHSDHVSPSLAYLHSKKLKELVDLEMIKNFDSTDLIEKCKNYKELDLTDEVNKDIFKLCEKLEETGEFEEFIEKLENGFQ